MDADWNAFRLQINAVSLKHPPQQSIFADLTDLKPLPPLDSGLLASTAFRLDESDPPIQDDLAPAELEQIDQPLATEDNDWLIEAADQPSKKRFHTWEQFGDPQVGIASQSRFLSEAPVRIYDAALHNAGFSTAQIIPQPPVLKAICSLMVGRPSFLFQWSHDKQRFTAILDNAVSGLSAQLSQAMIGGFVAQGSLFKQLRETRRSRLATMMAFKAAVDACLTSIEDWLHATAVQSLLQAHHLSQKISSILNLLSELQAGLHLLRSDDEVVSYIHDNQVLMNSVGSHTSLMHSLAQAVYQPWLARVVEQPGDTEGQQSILTQTDQDLLRRTHANMIYLRKHAPHRVPGLCKTTPQPKSEQPVEAKCAVWNAFAIDAAADSVADETPRPDELDLAVQHTLIGHLPVVGLSLVEDPVTIVRPSLNKQAELTTEAVLAHLLSDVGLLEQLQLRYRFFLCGDSDFVDRLRVAIFDEGRGDTLRLNDVATVKWPPTTSKLSLSLMSISADAAVSFTVRQLSEHDLQQACNAASIHALDFLQLKIETPPALDFFVSQEYDQIFAALLLNTRMLHLTTRLRRAVRLAGATHRLHHTVSVLASYSMDIAVALPWQDLLASVRSVNSFDDLKQKHARCLEQIRSRLFLRKKQLQIRQAIEALYTHVLLFAKTGDSDSGDVARLVATIAARLSEYVRSLESGQSMSEAEVEMVRGLRSRLSEASAGEL